MWEFSLRIAFVHDWLVTYGGAERVLEEMINCYPQADLFSLVDFLPKSGRDFIQNKDVGTSFIHKLPFAKLHYRNFLPLMPIAVEQFDLSEYDLIISSSHAVAKGVIVGPDQLHLCMCYTPIRYAWDLQHQYVSKSSIPNKFKRILMSWILHKIRIWDSRTASGVDQFIAISQFISRRIKKIYGRDSVVIYPPVDINNFSLREDKDDFYMTASRLVPYKNVHLLISAFNQMPHKRFVVIGDGPDFDRCKNLAGPNVEVLGWQPNEVLIDYMQRARAFVYGAEEDFGIVLVEAQACGTPLIAYGKGAAREIVRGLDNERPTGVLYDHQREEDIVDAVNKFEASYAKFDALTCRENSTPFGRERFKVEFKKLVESEVERFFVYK